ncbi:MAG: helix-turn-helix transcriptional regulator [Burkholderiales bacterium]|nr:helix-turn-helix transcriptional regulator [Burkholderiales bacterium]MCW5941885.1 helix-turn-helix transcriptional regulator [Fimbriimonadaceae bacterium]
MRYKTDLEAMVLAALGDGPAHGYGIVRTIRARSEGVLKMGEGQLYPILHRLEEEGLVGGDWEMQDGKPPRKVYTLTEAGHGALESRQREWGAFANAVARVFSKKHEAEAAYDHGAPSLEVRHA